MNHAAPLQADPLGRHFANLLTGHAGRPEPVELFCRAGQRVHQDPEYAILDLLRGAVERVWQQVKN